MLHMMWGHHGGHGLPFFGGGLMLGVMLFWLVLFLIVAYFVYLDANKHGMNGLLWGILVLIPVAGILFLILYIVIRETGGQKALPGEKGPMDILKERYARGEITSEQFDRISEDLKK
ncbi:MAG: SHOCT domain-containing protein [Methanospirillum sp.]